MAGTSAVPNADAPMFASAPMQLIPEPDEPNFASASVHGLRTCSSLHISDVQAPVGHMPQCRIVDDANAWCGCTFHLPLSSQGTRVILLMPVLSTCLCFIHERCYSVAYAISTRHWRHQLCGTVACAPLELAHQRCADAHTSAIRGWTQTQNFVHLRTRTWTRPIEVMIMQQCSYRATYTGTGD